MRRWLLGVSILSACTSISGVGARSQALAQAAPAVQATPASAASQTLPAGAVSQVVTEVIAAVRKNYVHPERVDAISKRLEAGLASARYNTASPLELSERMTVDLRESSGNDGHMYINFNPAESAARTRPGGDGGPPQGRTFFKEQMRRSNHGITELKVLPGNVRYLNLSQWFWDPSTTPKVYDDAVRFLSSGDAIVIDISRNGGGSAEAVNYLVSHFMEPGRKLMTFKDGPSNVEQTFTQKVPDGSLRGKPLFVLTSSRSGSASEEFASHIRHFKLGTLVGKTTGGAGNPNSLLPIAHGFVLSISTGLAIHPVTGKGWEGEGVAPHRDVELSKALDLAHLEALKVRLATASAQERPQLEWLISALSTNDAGAPLNGEQLRALAGSYDGERSVIERAGRLYWKRAEGPEVELIPLGGTRFAVGDRFGMRLDFGSAGQVLVTRPGAQPERIAKVTQLSGR